MYVLCVCVCVFVCMYYVYVCVCVFVCMYYVCVYLYVCIMCMCVCVFVCMYVCRCVCTRSVRKVSDRIFLCEHLMDYNLARLHEPTLNLSAHA